MGSLNIKFIFLLVASIFLSCNSSVKENPKSENKRKEPLFQKMLASQTNIGFVNEIPVDVEEDQFDYYYTANGAGVAIADLNNDGLQDVYFLANLGGNKCYINKGGFEFTEVSAIAGLSCNDGGWNTGVTCADVNSDGWMDIYVTRSGDRSMQLKQNLLFINQQDGTFIEQAKEFGINDAGSGTQSAFFDYDLDGDLDLYVMNHPSDWKRRSYTTSKQSDQNERGIDSDQFYENNGNYFKNISESAGLLPDGIGFGLGLAIGYLNNDLYPDIFVGNDYYGRDYLYTGKSDGSGFEEFASSRMKHISYSSMGCDISDLDNDGDSDILVMEMNAEDNFRQKTLMPSMDIKKFWSVYELGQHMQYMYNMLHMNIGNGFFSEVGQFAGISNTDWSWSVLAADYDLDGLKDLYITNGYPRDINDKDVYFRKAKDQFGNEVKVTSNEERLPLYKVTPLPNYAFKNTGGMNFNKSSNLWGVDDKGISMGAAYADLDNDGDLDLVVNNYNDTAFVYKNTASDLNLGSSFSVKLSGPAGNIDGIGSRVTVVTQSAEYVQDIFTTKGYQSCVPALAHFGIPHSETIAKVIVRWPNGTTQTVNEVINERMIIEYADNQAPVKIKSEKTAFTNTTEKRLTPIFSHIENSYNDYVEEVLLPHVLSRSGPALAVGDLNGDNLEDIIIGGSSGQPAAIYIQQFDNTFLGSISENIKKESGHEDVAALIFDYDNDGDNDIYFGSGGNEHAEGSLFYQDRLYRNDKGTFVRDINALPDLRLATKTVKPNDFDNDGDLDLFVGASHVPRKYGADAPAALLRNDNGKFTEVNNESAPMLNNIGMVNEALWADIDGDSREELLLAGDWMPIRIFKWKGNVLHEITNQSGIESHKGWWSALTAADIDNDGDLDILAGNLGLNYKYKASPSEPFKLFAGDYDKSGTWDIALGYYNNGVCYPVRGRQCSSQQMPSIVKKFPTYKEFGSATIYDVYGREKLETGLAKEANNFSSIYLENDGSGHFTLHDLPGLAQVSCINSFIVEDFNKDGNKDIVLAGNLFNSEIETPRNDASYGLLLVGDGNGNFSPKEVIESGIFLPSDVKRLASIKMGGTSGFVVGNNNAPIELYEIAN
ncbi:MAG: hypothetical protein ACI9FU_002063 [Granulosicoccus sp.]|jgi:hypothetical protein